MTAPLVSRPTYASLEPRPCHGALMVADDAGLAALAALAESAPDLMAKARVLHVQGGPATAPRPDLNAAHMETVAATADLDAALDRALQGATMGLQAFLAGSEGLIGQAQARLLAAGLSPGAIQTEHRGSPARRMQCVHCKTMAEDVTTDPYRCPGCSRSLYGRDHLSRRLGAFQAVCVDAETPGDIPHPVKIT